MTFDPTKPVKMRGDDRPVRIICTDARPPNSIIGIVTNKDGPEELYQWKSDGRFILGSRSPNDLINIPETREVVVRVYRDNYGRPSLMTHWAETEVKLHPWQLISETRVKVEV